MSIRPFRDIKRRKTKVINVGKVKIGGDNPISVQSMTNTLTSDSTVTTSISPMRLDNYADLRLTGTYNTSLDGEVVQFRDITT